MHSTLRHQHGQGDFSLLNKSDEDRQNLANLQRDYFNNDDYVMSTDVDDEKTTISNSDTPFDDQDEDFDVTTSPVDNVLTQCRPSLSLSRMRINYILTWNLH